ncbi:MAG: ArnT family glycosyltransferase [bacterium]
MNASRCPDSTNVFAMPIFLFVLVWWMNFFLYPLWYLPGTTQNRAIALCVIFAIFTALSLLFRWLGSFQFENITHPHEPTGDGAFFVLLFGAAFVLHIPFLNLPILTGLDTIDHAAVPGVVAHRVVKALSDAAGLTMQPVLTLGFIGAIAVWILMPAFRYRSIQRVQSIADWAATHLFLTLLILAGVTAGYAAVLLQTEFPERFGDLQTLFRYQPLSKLILTPLYLFLGLHEWIGRTVQILFTFGGAWYLYRLARLFGGEWGSRCAAVEFVFLPPVFHYGNTHMIEGGILFFISAAFFYWIRFVERKYQLDLLLGTLCATWACLYKHTAVSLMPAFAFMAAYDFCFPKHSRTIAHLFASFIACVIPGVTLVLYMQLAGFNSDMPSTLVFPTPARLLGNLAAIPAGVTWPIALLFLAGIIVLPFRPNRRPFWILTGWIGAHWVLTSMSAAAGNVRQALPYYVGLIVISAWAWDGWFSGRSRIPQRVALAVLSVFLLGTCLFADRHPDFRHVGRAMGDRSYINYSNWDECYLPYPELVIDLSRDTTAGDVIYAPMANEPVFFYLAKYNLDDRTYRRDPFWNGPTPLTPTMVMDKARVLGAKWLVLPRGRWLYPYVEPEFLETFFTTPPPGLRPVKVLTLGKEQLGLWRIEHDAS